MDTKHLTYILTITERKNMTKAAEELHVSQSSLSQYLSKLEQELGTPLFIRAKGELVPTPAGQYYIEAVKKVLSIKEELYQNIHGLKSKSHITIGTTSQFGLQIIGDILPSYKKAYPDVTIEISETSVPFLTQMLLEENIDCGIMALNAISPFDAEQVPLVRKEEILFSIPANHPYRSQNPYNVISQNDIITNFKDNEFLLGKKESTLRYLADKLFESSHFHPHLMCETNSIIAIRSIIAGGGGVSFIAESCALNRSKIAYYSIKPQLFRYNALVCRKNWILNRPEKALIEYIENSFKKNRLGKF